jgi:hypothetical protein
MIRVIVIFITLLTLVGSTFSADLPLPSSEGFRSRPAGLPQSLSAPANKPLQRDGPVNLPRKAGKPSQLARSYSPQCPIAGRYAVKGSLPGTARSYRGEAVIRARGIGCYVKWLPPNDSEGTGNYKSGVLTIRWTFASGGHGVIRYTRGASGELNGMWWKDNSPSNKGTEKLTLIERAPRR